MIEPSVLIESSIFKNLDPLLIDQLLERGEQRFAAGNTSLFCAGDEYAEEIYVVLSGVVQVQRLDGKTYEVESGDFVGLSSFLDGDPYSSTAFCPGDVTLLVLSESCFTLIKNNFPGLSTAVNRSLSSRLRRWTPERRGTSGALVQKVRTAMTTPFVACSETTTLLKALALMRTRKIGALGVIDKQGVLLGMISPELIADLVLLKASRSRHTSFCCWYRPGADHRPGSATLGGGSVSP